MSKKPLLFPTNKEKPSSKLTWKSIPFFSGYRLGFPDLVVKDMRCPEEYPNGVVVPQGIAKGHLKKHIGQKFVKIVGDDGVVYKSFINDILDLVVQDNTKDKNKEVFERSFALPSDFRPVGQYNYKNKEEIVKEYWKNRREF